MPRSCITVQKYIDGCAGLAIKQMMESERTNAGAEGERANEQNKNSAHRNTAATHIEKSNRIRSGADCLENVRGERERRATRMIELTQKDMCSVCTLYVLYIIKLY